ncbi:MAG: hypothetical protein EPN68_09570 [Rhodanobacter sp.]|nr:MAG: hypothetical protein EPN68_09570 [Rhodanobacter sp.]
MKNERWIPNSLNHFLQDKSRGGWAWPSPVERLFTEWGLRQSVAQRDPARVLAALCVAEEMKAGIGATAQAIVASASSAGVKLSPTQVSHYFDGRYMPSPKIVNPLAERMGLPSLRMLSEWPWELLTPRQLTVNDIERACSPPYKTMFRLPNNRPESFNQRGRSRWHVHEMFNPAGYYLLKPGAPEAFWLRVAGVRAALALSDYESFNAHFFAAVKLLPSVAQHRAVRPHVPMLLTCVGMLLEHVGHYYRWFRVNWDAVEFYLATETYGPKTLSVDSGAMRHDAGVRGRDDSVGSFDRVFYGVFQGNGSGVGMEYESRGVNPLHPANLARSGARRIEVGATKGRSRGTHPSSGHASRVE